MDTFTCGKSASSGPSNAALWWSVATELSLRSKRSYSKYTSWRRPATLVRRAGRSIFGVPGEGNARGSSRMVGTAEAGGVPEMTGPMTATGFFGWTVIGVSAGAMGTSGRGPHAARRKEPSKTTKSFMIPVNARALRRTIPSEGYFSHSAGELLLKEDGIKSQAAAVDLLWRPVNTDSARGRRRACRSAALEGRRIRVARALRGTKGQATNNSQRHPIVWNVGTRLFLSTRWIPMPRNSTPSGNASSNGREKLWTPMRRMAWRRRCHCEAKSWRTGKCST